MNVKVICLTLIVVCASRIAIATESTIQSENHFPTKSNFPKTDYHEAFSDLSNAKKTIEQQKHMSLEFKTIEDVGFILSQPLKLAKSICVAFQLPFKKFIEQVGKHLVIGEEAVSRPVVSSIKILEKVFVPDVCLLRKFCQIGHHLEVLRKKILTFSPSLLEGSEFVKAITDGIIGKDCELEYDDCKLSIKPEYKI